MPTALPTWFTPNPAWSLTEDVRVVFEMMPVARPLEVSMGPELAGGDFTSDGYTPAEWGSMSTLRRTPGVAWRRFTLIMVGETT